MTDVAAISQVAATPQIGEASSTKGPGITAAHAMLRHGAPPPPRVMALLENYPAERDAILTLLHQQLGNQYVQEVTASVAPPPSPTGEVAATAAPGADGVLVAPLQRVVLGVTISAPAGVHTAAVDECAKFVEAEVGKNEYAQQHLAKANVAIVIIPAMVAMTDVPSFQHLRGTKTFDGRDWATVRGSGGTQTPDGHFAMAVAEENLVQVKDRLKEIGSVKLEPYPATYSIGMHELAHILEAKGLTPEEQARVKQLYANHIKADPGDAHDTFTDKYGASNEQEYFAQSTNAFFERNVMGANHSGRAWLQKNDPDMYAFLVTLYDTHHNANGAVTQ